VAIVPADDPRALDLASEQLLAGRAVVLPTETVYGLAALPSVPGATAQLFTLKGRPEDVPLAVLVDSIDQVAAWVEPPSAAVERLCETHWPGPLTVVLRRRADVHLELGGDGRTVGVRCPDHDLVRRLARRVGPIATTSANRHGEPTPVTAQEVAEVVGQGDVLALDGGRCAGVASTVVDATGPRLRILRRGPVALQ
jgi:tRNA threonylcarbamoyl adenosine modification protein (Sua5/YciO/YrdC/YwlC family)